MNSSSVDEFRYDKQPNVKKKKKKDRTSKFSYSDWYSRQNAVFLDLKRNISSIYLPLIMTLKHAISPILQENHNSSDWSDVQESYYQKNNNWETLLSIGGCSAGELLSFNFPRITDDSRTFIAFLLQWRVQYFLNNAWAPRHGPNHP